MNVNAKAVAAADKLFQEFMRVQGALPTLVNMLKQEDNSKQELVEVIGTIRMLLLRNKLMQAEIIQLDGYSVMVDVPERLVDLEELASEMELARGMTCIVSLASTVLRAPATCHSFILLFSGQRLLL